jgi:phosphoribosylanthranilate isomerase
MVQTLHWIAGEDSPAEGLVRELERIAAVGIVDRVLIDSKVGTAGGGTGVAYDWSAARAVFAAAPSALRLIVAGGLRPENVGSAIGQVKPWGVDVSSGVEMSPVRKDPALVELFVKNARG